MISALEEGPGAEPTTKIESLELPFLGSWIYQGSYGGAPLVVKFSAELGVRYSMLLDQKCKMQLPIGGSYILV